MDILPPVDRQPEDRLTEDRPDGLTSVAVSCAPSCVGIPDNEEPVFKAVRENDLAAIQRYLQEGGVGIDIKHGGK